MGDPKGFNRPNSWGSSRIRPIANIVRVEELLAAFWLAMIELTRARNTSRKPMPPHALRASTFCHGLLSSAVKPIILAGPKATALA